MSASIPSGVTPSMVQFFQIKHEHPDCLLFFQMGDFYELFFEDAVHAAAALDIALTKRGKHQGEDIAMCGVPLHAATNYLLTLIRKGFRGRRLRSGRRSCRGEETRLESSGEAGL